MLDETSAHRTVSGDLLDDLAVRDKRPAEDRRVQAVVATPLEREVLWWFRSGGGFGMSGSSGSGSW
jgi:hypothetical protein